MRRFTDDPLVAGETPIRALHFVEPREPIDGLRLGVGLGSFSWTDAVLTARLTRVRSVHLVELRSALAEAYAAAGPAAPRWTPAVAGSPIRAQHLMELSRAVLALE